VVREEPRDGIVEVGEGDVHAGLARALVVLRRGGGCVGVRHMKARLVRLLLVRGRGGRLRLGRLTRERRRRERVRACEELHRASRAC